jgi:hypothetical protein
MLTARFKEAPVSATEATHEGRTERAASETDEANLSTRGRI